MSEPPKTIDEYLAAVPEDARASLQQLRETIRAAAPEATEVISYRVPAFRHLGLLVGFAAFKNHCSFFLMSTDVIKTHAVDLEGYDTSSGTIRFRPEKPLPADLITKLVAARIAENEQPRRSEG